MKRRHSKEYSWDQKEFNYGYRIGKTYFGKKDYPDYFLEDKLEQLKNLNRSEHFINGFRAAVEKLNKQIFLNYENGELK